jgi:hypothetical protein
MSEHWLSARRTRGIRSVIGLALCLGTASGCVTHTPGLEVALVLEVALPPAIRDARLTLVELLPCPGTTNAVAHSHGESAPWSMSLGDHDTAMLTPRVGRYCDLRLQIEGDSIAPRQAVLPLTCGTERAELLLDDASLDTVHVVRVRAPGLRDDGSLEDPPHALEQLVRALDASTCE